MHHVLGFFYLTQRNDMPNTAKVIMNADDIQRTVKRISHEIIEKNHGIEDVVIVGIITRGVPLANRISAQISEIEGKEISHGQIDITMFRDDYQTYIKAPVTISEFPNIHNKTVILVDDVLFTGRTVRAGIDAIFEYGRPKKIQLAVLVDRGHRELPIKPDFVGKNIPTSELEKVKVMLIEQDGSDEVSVLKPE